MDMKDIVLWKGAEIEASELFEDGAPAPDKFGDMGGNVNWAYCTEHARFQHKDDDACEFMLHIGSDKVIFAKTCVEMAAYGCTAEFIEAYALAQSTGAIRVIFYC